MSFRNGGQVPADFEVVNVKRNENKKTWEAQNREFILLNSWSICFAAPRSMPAAVAICWPGKSSQSSGGN